MKRFPPAFYRVGAVASFISVLTTLALIFLPDLYAPAEGLEGRMQRVNDPAYSARSWIYLAHPLLASTAALAVAVRLRGQSALILPGAIGFGLWACVEAGQQTMTLFMFDPWRRAWLAGDPAARETMDVRIAVYDGLWEASYWLLLIAFLIGCACYAAALLRLGGFTRVVGAFYAGAVLLTLGIFAGGLGGPALPPSIERWVYAALQPLGRFMIGAWLWKYATEGTLREELSSDGIPSRA